MREATVPTHRPQHKPSLPHTPRSSSLFWLGSGLHDAVIYVVLCKCPLSPVQGRKGGVWGDWGDPSSNWVALSVTQRQDPLQQAAHRILGKQESIQYNPNRGLCVGMLPHQPDAPVQPDSGPSLCLCALKNHTRPSTHHFTAAGLGLVNPGTHCNEQDVMNVVFKTPSGDSCS